jgi:hypothetical protein
MFGWIFAGLALKNKFWTVLPQHDAIASLQNAAILKSFSVYKRAVGAFEITHLPKACTIGRFKA